MLQLFASFSWHVFYQNSDKMNINLKNIGLPPIYLHEFVHPSCEQPRDKAAGKEHDHVCREQTLKMQRYYIFSW